MFLYLLKTNQSKLVYYVHEIKHNDIHFLFEIPVPKPYIPLAHQYIMNTLLDKGYIPSKYKGMKWDSPEVQRLYGFKNI